MRAFVPGLASPHPMGERLPAMYLEDSFVQRMTTALDTVVAPIYSNLDCLDAYIDPDLTPEDFLVWLGEWVGMALDESWPVERRRAVIAQAVDLYRVRGTSSGLSAYLRLLTGLDVEIEETGGTAWSTTPDAAPPGSPNFAMVVRMRAPDPRQVDRARLEALVTAAKPAHVLHRIELMGPEQPPQPPPSEPPPEPPPAPPPPDPGGPPASGELPAQPPPSPRPVTQEPPPAAEVAPAEWRVPGLDDEPTSARARGRSRAMRAVAPRRAPTTSPAAVRPRTRRTSR
jgi:phage tail-like protein